MATISSTSSSSAIFIPEINSTYIPIPTSANSIMTKEEFDKERSIWIETIQDRMPPPLPSQSTTNTLKSRILKLFSPKKSLVRKQMDENLEILRNIPEKTLREMSEKYGNDSRDWPSNIRVLSESYKKNMLIERDKKEFLSFLNRSLEANFLRGFDVTYSEEFVEYTYAENFSFLATELLRNKPEEVKFASFAQFLIKIIQRKQNDLSSYAQTLVSGSGHWFSIWREFLNPIPRYDIAAACVEYLPHYPLDSIYNILRNIQDYDLSYSVLSIIKPDEEAERDSASILRLEMALQRAESNVMKLEGSIAKQGEKNGKYCTIYLDDTPELTRARSALNEHSKSYNNKLSQVKGKTEVLSRKAFKQNILDYFRLRTDMLKKNICNTIPPNDSSVVDIINSYLIIYPMRISSPRPATSIISPENVTVVIKTTESPKTSNLNLAESTSLRSVAQDPISHVATGLERRAPGIKFHAPPTTTNTVVPRRIVKFHLSDPTYASLIAQFASITINNPFPKDRISS